MTSHPESQVLAVFDSAGTPLTTAEVADDLDYSRRTAYNRLTRLVERGHLESKKVGARGRVWWLPARADLPAREQHPLNGQFDIPLTEVLLGMVDSSPAALAIVDRAHEIRYANARFGAALGTVVDDPVGRPLDSLFETLRDEDGVTITGDQSPIARVFETGDAVVEAHHELVLCDGTDCWVSIDVVPITADDAAVECVGVAVTDISDYRRRERSLESQRTELLRLNRINSVIRGISKAITTAQTRAELEDAVCTHIARSDLYLFAVLGEFASSHTEFTPLAAAGISTDYLEAILDNPDAPPLDEGPGATATKTGTVQVVQHISDLPYEYWRSAAETNRFRSFAAIPLVHRDIVYGVLAVYAKQPAAFDDDEQRLLQELGEMIGYGLHAFDTAEQLQSDQQIEVGFRSAILGDVFAELGEDVAFRVDGTVSLENETQLQYWTVSGCQPKPFLQAADDRSAVLDATLLKRTGDSFRLEVHTAAESVGGIFRSFDGRLIGAGLEAGSLRITSRFPITVDIDELLTAVQELYPDLTVADQRLVYTPRLLRTLAEDRVTERQWATIQRAYYAGYFEQPRQRNGDELAEQMDVTTTTFHRHLRNAEEEIFRVLFEPLPEPRE